MVKWVGRDELLDAVKPLLKPVDVLLDLGCGIRPQKLIRPTVHICCDAYEPYLEALAREPHQVLLVCSADDAMQCFPRHSLDAIYMLDVIEHLNRREAEVLLKNAVALAKQQVVIFTPIGFLPQNEEDTYLDAWGMHGGFWQKHRSGWEPKDFEGPGWEVIGAQAFHDRFGAFWAVWTRE